MGRSAVDLDTSLLDIEMDSLTLVSIAGQLEAVYDLELTAEEAAALFGATSIRDIAAIVKGAIRRQAGG